MTTAAFTTGFVNGALHAVTGPDHLAAILPFAIGKGSRALFAGAFWGLGHGIGVFLQGLLLAAIGPMFGIDFLHYAGYMNYVAGLSLIVIGLIGFKASYDERQQEIGDAKKNDGDRSAEASERHGHAMDNPASTILTGTFQGFSGGGHLVGLIPALTLDFLGIVTFLFAFGIAMAVAMALFALVVGEVSIRLPIPPAHKLAYYTSGLAIFLGCILMLVEFD
eukprot:TRINITY_DN6047_c0_g1_i1.p1 TRINITY_DN6047_c0_g1~~TRINITY_DN6047_c0_g1_i1.p1  ORF type:complete len:221 (-),score=28.50 TRINITY_DN6047_c0_g1_i1:69-731(-)